MMHSSHRAPSPMTSSASTEVVPPHHAVAGHPAPAIHRGLLVYVMLGIAFGVVLTKSEVISWFRIQEMFRFQAFHMYGVIGSAVVTAALSLQLIRRFKSRALNGELVVVPSKVLGKGTRYWLGGTIFGLGWGIVGACPGPMFALIGGGLTVMSVTLASAIAGTWMYGALRPYLPH